MSQKIWTAMDGDRTPIDQHPAILRHIQSHQAAQADGGEVYRAG